jgi:hypothetical protein
MLIEDVAAMRPSIGDLEGGCRHIRRTSRFCPAIAEVLQAISEARQLRQDVTRKIANIAQSRDQHVREVEQEHRQRQEYLDYHKGRYQPLCGIDPSASPL